MTRSQRQRAAAYAEPAHYRATVSDALDRASSRDLPTLWKGNGPEPEPVTPAPKPHRGRGRPRTHENVAARMRAYRARLKASKC